MDLQVGERKLLCIADDSPECRAAVYFGARRAANTHAILTILRVIEPLDPGLWSAMGEAMRDRMRNEAFDDLQGLAEVAQQATGITPELVVKEGILDQAIRAYIDTTPSVKTLLLAAASGRGGPGPLVAAAMRGGFGFGLRAVAIMIVPAGLSDADLSELAS
ncbi:universal stress protein [Candidatus Phycosocius spiralis]|uniref:Universal stress protein A n=1 Tax=Candidatus Phycosocius spiralis TaxID=2815099 RepID=A0ABQ4PUZ6_9PROT|nr:universal stress protein [Candidatus Phycosocius spiralis]GIU66803.1 universal stress protein A [Candidatus Phycosocius spiralis]